MLRSGINDPCSSERDATLHALLHEIDRLRANEEGLRAELAELLEARFALEGTRDYESERYNFVPVACLTLDRYGSIRAANRAALSLVRLDLPQLLGAPLLCLLAAVHRPRFLTHLVACHRNGKDVAFEALLKGAGGQGIPARLLLRAINQDSGGYWVALVDLRERDAAFAEGIQLGEAQRLAREADQLKEGLLVLLSHGSRGPLARVIAAAWKLAARGALDPSVTVPLSELLQVSSLLERRERRRRLIRGRLPQRPHQLRFKRLSEATGQSATVPRTRSR